MWSSPIVFRMVDGLTLVCPVRGRLKVTGRTADGLTPSEERFRVEAIKYLIDKGYPKSHFVIEPVIKRFGNGGRNSFRADFAVLDVPAAEVGHTADELLEHAVLLAEVKRSNASADDAKQYQVKPLLAFAAHDRCMAVYWDDVERRVFWQAVEDGHRVVQDGPIASLPPFGGEPGLKPLMIADLLKYETSLKSIFERIEDVLHAASIGPARRFTMMLQLLLAKLHDEHQHEIHPDQPLVIQDYRSLGVGANAAKTTFNELLAAAAKYYERHLPEPVSKTLVLTDDAFLEVMSILAPHQITAMRHSVIQEFYMYFAKGLYKWDLAQYFTPPTVTDFIVDVVNPQWDEQVRDPACGSADFLTAAFRRGQHFPDYASRVWGADVSAEAVQVAVLNMVLNGDGKSNIKKENSLDSVNRQKDEWDVVVCNPPFGVKIKELSQTILKKYDLGRAQESNDDGEWFPTRRVLESQETGILFAELCVRLARPGSGRVALVLPNGYLGNKSARYLQLRQWLLRNARIAAIVALPRFTFKGSGADVSASVIFLERRETALDSVFEVEEYDIAVQVIDRVGWSTGDKKAAPTFRRDTADGTFVLDENSEMILDSDFGAVLSGIRLSDASQDFPWLTANAPADEQHADRAWSVSSKVITDDPLFTMDAKRLNQKYLEVVAAIRGVEHARLGDLAEFVDEGVGADGEPLAISKSSDYRYVELQSVESGSYRSETLKGWQLPARARHGASPGDFFVGAVWGSVRKWMLVGQGSDDLLVTNGMHRLRLKPEHAERVVDLVAAFSTEAYRVQMRARARGSDGLAEVSADDVADVLIPLVTDAGVRTELWPFVQQLIGGFTSVEQKVAALAAENRLPSPPVAPRASHVMVV